MSFSKTFPKSTDKSVYPKWEEIYLSVEQEKEIENQCRLKNVQIMKECVEDAKLIVQEKRLLESQLMVVELAKSLFDKRASHEIFHKENKAKELFDQSVKEK